MNSQTRFYRLIAWLFVFAVCLIFPGSLVQAQEIPTPGPASSIQNAPPVQALRGALERNDFSIEELLRLLELPVSQKALVLTDEQSKKVGDISFNFRRAAIRQQAVLRVQRLELGHMMRTDIPDRAAIDKKVQEVAQAQSNIMSVRINALMDLRSILTKEQRDKIREFFIRRFQQTVRTRFQQPQPGMRLAPPVPPVPPAKPKQPLPQ